MVANKYFPTDPTPPTHTLGMEVKIQLFQNMVMLHIKLKGITNAATWYQIFACRRTPPPFPGGGGQNSTFSEHGHVAYQRIIDGLGLICLFFWFPEHCFRASGGVKGDGVKLWHCHAFIYRHWAIMVYSEKLLNIIALIKCEDYHTKKANMGFAL